jgi:probable HAF family extracellular repeat protein
LTTATTRAQSRYTISDLGTLGGKTSLATGVNNRGEVIGSADLPGNTGSFHAFIYKLGKMEDLGTLGGTCRILARWLAVPPVTPLLLTTGIRWWVILISRMEILTPISTVQVS